jgi:hypothetical protein
VRAELPKIPGLAQRLIGKPASFDLVRRIVRGLLEVDNQLVDLDGFESCDGDVEIFLDEKLSELWEFYGQMRPIPSGIGGDLVVRKQQGALLRLAEPLDPDDGHSLETQKLGSLNATVTADCRRGLIDENRHEEAKRADTVGDLANLFLRMRTRVARVGLDLANGEKFDLVHENLHSYRRRGRNQPSAKGN